MLWFAALFMIMFMVGFASEDGFLVFMGIMGIAVTVIVAYAGGPSPELAVADKEVIEEIKHTRTKVVFETHAASGIELMWEIAPTYNSEGGLANYSLALKVKNPHYHHFKTVEAWSGEPLEEDLLYKKRLMSADFSEFLYENRDVININTPIREQTIDELINSYTE